MSAGAVTRASVEDKSKRYLLNPAHPLGKEKARFFRQALGFTLDNPQGLSQQLIFSPASAIQGEFNEFGTKYVQWINVTGANGRSILVKSVWMKGLDGFVRFVTAYPGD